MKLENFEGMSRRNLLETMTPTQLREIRAELRGRIDEQKNTRYWSTDTEIVYIESGHPYATQSERIEWLEAKLKTLTTTEGVGDE